MCARARGEPGDEATEVPRIVLGDRYVSLFSIEKTAYLLGSELSEYVFSII